ncbi:TOMM leader peptide-binding protein [Sulfidibacter corallicola]|uniref:TOMM leader peptide-binding protein n=1 Tax=Sulfidibacter corallicola TaxID=2818388 RepID=A0A8A4TJF3_SULCO|nr:TOMM precursor leader peptide-binding protein [Sulfidibacter corallicola]QTD48928.1 TOMM precursor leader peptide-binding protein [Sulfidibacter corallicola]
MRYPRLKPKYRYAVCSGKGVFLCDEDRAHLISGSLYEDLIPLLDGRMDDESLVGALAADYSSAQVFYGIGLLHKQGFLDERSCTEDLEAQAFWQELGEGVHPNRKGLDRFTIGVEDLVTQDGGTAGTFTDLGLEIGGEPALVVVRTSNYLDPRLEDYNQKFLESNQPWMVLNTEGTRPWIGPILVQGKTSCWTCLTHRLSRNRPIEKYLHDLGPAEVDLSTPRAALPSTRAAAMALAATEIGKWAAGLPSLENKIAVLDTRVFDIQHHQITKRLQCPACGRPEGYPIGTGDKPRLSGQAIGDITLAGYRREPPQRTYARLAHLVSPITGIVRQIIEANDAETRHHAPVFVSRHQMGRTYQSFDALMRELAGRSEGKGIDRDQARTSALCESIERYAGSFQGDETRLRGRFEDMKPDAIHPNRVQLFSARQYAERDRWNQREIEACHIPQPFDTKADIEWSPLHSMVSGKTRYLPTALCYQGYAGLSGSEFGTANFNGCAAGSCMDEAIIQGFLELVERDQVAIWWYNRLACPSVDLATFTEPFFAQIQAFYRSLGRNLHLLFISTDLGIPTFAAISYLDKGPQREMLLGFGAHFDANIAMARALTEVNQKLSLVRNGALEHLEADPRHEAELTRRWYRDENLETQPFLRPAGLVSRDDLPRREFTHFGQAIDACIALSARRGLDLLVLDQTRPDIDLAVVRVVVPGLRHFWPRFAAGRLFDAPVEAELFSKPIEEELFHDYFPIF